MGVGTFGLGDHGQQTQLRLISIWGCRRGSEPTSEALAGPGTGNDVDWIALTPFTHIGLEVMMVIIEGSLPRGAKPSRHAAFFVFLAAAAWTWVVAARQRGGHSGVPIEWGEIWERKRFAPRQWIERKA